jgi:hypothetical protein
VKKSSYLNLPMLSLTLIHPQDCANSKLMFDIVKTVNRVQEKYVPMLVIHKFGKDIEGLVDTLKTMSYLCLLFTNGARLYPRYIIVTFHPRIFFEQYTSFRWIITVPEIEV